MKKIRLFVTLFAAAVIDSMNETQNKSQARQYYIMLPTVVAVCDRILKGKKGWNRAPVYAFGTNASLDFMKYVSISIGSGNTMVEFFSAEMVFSVWR